MQVSIVRNNGPISMLYNESCNFKCTTERGKKIDSSVPLEVQ